MRDNLANFASRTSLLYALIAAAWIWLSDDAVRLLFPDPDAMHHVSTYKGLAFVAVTASLLYLLLRVQLRRWERETAERKRAEIALANEVEMRRALFAHSPDGIVIVDPETARPIEFNDAACRQLGYSREEFARLSLFDLEAKETTEESRAHIQTVLREGGSDFETLQRTRQGDTRNIHVTAQTVKVQDRSVYYCVWRDITAAKQAEHVLKRFQFSIDQASDAVFWMNRDAGFTYVNEQACRSLGYTREELLRLHLSDIDPVFPKHLWIERWDRYQEGRRGGVEHLLSAHRRKDGTTFPVEVVSKHLWFGDEEFHVAFVRDITERQQSEAAMRASEERLVHVLETVPDGIAIVNRAGQITYANSGAEHLLGLSRSSITIRTYNDPAWKSATVDGQPFPEDQQPFTRVMQSEQPVYGIEQVIEHADGRRVTLSINAAPLREASGKLTGIVAAFTDITGAKAADAALRTSEQRFRLAQSAAGIGTWDVDLLRDYATWSEQEEAIFGFTPGEYDHTSATFWNLVHPEDRERVRTAAEEVMRTRGEFDAEYRILRHGDHALRWISVRGRAVHDAAGRAIRMIGVNLDITERQQADMALRDSEERYRGLFTAMQEGFALHEIICDAAGRAQDYRYLEVNPAFEQMTGIPRTRWIGHTVREVLPHVEDSWIQGFGEVALTGVARTFENYVKELGHHYEVLAYSPKPGQFAVLALDVTQRRRAELALRQKTEELDRYFSTSLDLFCITDNEGRFRRLNKQWERTLGYSLEELEGRSFLELVHPDDREATEITNQAAARGQVLNFVNRYRRKDGEYRWIEWTSHPSGNLIFAAARDVTERKRAEVELERNHELYRNAIVAANAIPYQKDYARDTYRFMADGIQDVLGYAPSELRSSLWRKIILETEFMGEAAGLTGAEAARRALAGEIKHWRADHRVRTRSGEIRWISDASIPLLNDEGQYVGSIGIIQDITERKQAEEAIRRSEANLAIAQRVAHLGSWEIDLTRGTSQWSEETWRIFGLRPGAFIPTREAFQAMVHPDDRDRVQAAVQHSIQTGHSYAVDHRILLPDETERIVSERADALSDDQGRVTRLVGTVQDVTELRRIEQALQRSEKHFRSIIDTVQDMISIVDVSGVIRFASPSAERALGYAPEQLLDREVFDYIPPDEHASVRTALARALAEPHQPVAVQHRFRHANGSWCLLESVGNLLGGESARALVVNSRDITDRRRLEEQLRQSQKMEAIGQLAAGVAHDFNNLLTIIQGNASLLLGTPGLSGEDAISMSQIIEASERAAGLTRQLLMFSRKQVMQLATLDLNEIVGNMTKMLQRILGEDITLRSEYAPNLPLIRADAGMLEQVLLNLAVNARDAMPEGGQLLLQTAATTLDPQEVAAHPESVAGRHVCLRVTDTGCGIASDNLPRIFDPFFTTKEVGKGTGLGLATVYGIIKQHRGWIEVTSEIGQGTAFLIYLPAEEGSTATQRTLAAAQELPRGHEVILVVEDEPAVRLLVSNLLQRCGYTVLVAESGIAALEVWKDHQDRIQLLLTDMVMPDGMSGRELARRLQQEKPDFKTIYTSGYSAATTNEVPPLTEGVNFLQKPYPPYHLAKTVRAFLDRA